MNSFEDFEPDTEIEEDNSGIWLSISDLMSGLLLTLSALKQQRFFSALAKLEICAYPTIEHA